jgi:hypothetical protein
VIWQLVTAGNALTAATYAALTWTLGARLQRTGQLSPRVNPLGAALLAVLGTVALRAALLTAQMLGLDPEAARALRDGWTMWSVPLPFVAAATGLVYLRLRRRAGDDAGPGSLYPDHALRRRRALEINDNIVQGLLAARELDAIGGRAEAHVALGRTLEQAQRMMDELLDAEVRPGDLRRVAAAAERADLTA